MMISRLLLNRAVWDGRREKTRLCKSRPCHRTPASGTWASLSRWPKSQWRGVWAGIQIAVPHQQTGVAMPLSNRPTAEILGTAWLLWGLPGCAALAAGFPQLGNRLPSRCLAGLPLAIF